jgi:hypothetical protein
MTPSIMSLSIMTLSIMTLSLMTLSAVTISIMTLSKNNFHPNNTQHVTCFIVKLNVVTLSVSTPVGALKVVPLTHKYYTRIDQIREFALWQEIVSVTKKKGFIRLMRSTYG